MGELRGHLGDFDDNKIWKAHGEAKRQEEVDRQLPTILEEAETVSSFETHGGGGGGRSIRAVFEMMGIVSIFQDSGKLTRKKRC